MGFAAHPNDDVRAANTGNALGFGGELDASQREAIQTFVERVTEGQR